SSSSKTFNSCINGVSKHIDRQQLAMMLLSQLPKFNSHLAAAIISFSSPSLHSRAHFLIPKLNKHSPYNPFRALKSTLASQIRTLADSDAADEVETPVELSLEKLFIPPDTDISENAPLAARVLKGSNIVLSRYARDAQVTTAEFVKSSVKTEDCPAEGLPEFALVGRSNVGKSSLLNSIVKRKKLALTSKKPGKTQCINHFRINDSWFLVDLPGYGYVWRPDLLFFMLN
uniref:EngB-type G domain-containing protein n=1 Tax=Kalanchoe fedtschenkoi TaxID=63787 RepID=A0A7N0V860_KALFE